MRRLPALSSIIAADGYLPRQLAHRGDRLVFSNGIVVLAVTACVLLAAFGGRTTALIPRCAPRACSPASRSPRSAWSAITPASANTDGAAGS